MEKCAPQFCKFFVFGYNREKYLSLCRAYLFFLHIGTHPSKIGGELVYYRLYHKKGKFYLYVYLKLFNTSFIVFLV